MVVPERGLPSTKMGLTGGAERGNNGASVLMRRPSLRRLDRELAEATSRPANDIRSAGAGPRPVAGSLDLWFDAAAKGLIGGRF
jgi:hypothetical protein